MGPRSRERGNGVPRRSASRESSRLQWGRAHVSAETFQLKSTWGYLLEASMGPRSRERGNPHHPEGGVGNTLGFNGAALT